MSDISFISIQDSSFLQIDRKEVNRYLKIHKQNTDLDQIIDEVEREVRKNASLRAVYLKTELDIKESIINFGFDVVNSANLSKNLFGCRDAYVFCATLGADIDRLIKRYSAKEPSKALVADSISSTLIESFCNYINDYLSKDKCTCPRFSAGYGDFSIVHQASILNVLDTKRKLGVVLTDSYMMTPSKTVTAVIGIK